ncbi:MAG: hypothetical protein WC943_16675 [Elusimicrobiota bacterium]
MTQLGTETILWALALLGVLAFSAPATAAPNAPDWASLSGEARNLVEEASGGRYLADLPDKLSAATAEAGMLERRLLDETVRQRDLRSRALRLAGVSAGGEDAAGTGPSLSSGLTSLGKDMTMTALRVKALRKDLRFIKASLKFSRIPDVRRAAEVLVLALKGMERAALVLEKESYWAYRDYAAAGHAERALPLRLQSRESGFYGADARAFGEIICRWVGGDHHAER